MGCNLHHFDFATSIIDTSQSSPGEDGLQRSNIGSTMSLLVATSQSSPGEDGLQRLPTSSHQLTSRQVSILSGRGWVATILGHDMEPPEAVMSQSSPGEDGLQHPGRIAFRGRWTGVSILSGRGWVATCSSRSSPANLPSVSILSGRGWVATELED